MIATITRYPLLKIFRYRAFMCLWSGQFVSTIGDGIFRLALALQVLRLSSSALVLSLVLFASVVPEILCKLLGGVAADRLPRKRILLITDIGRTLVVGLIALLAWMHTLQLWHLFVLACLFGIANGFFSPAYRALRPQLVASTEEYQAVASFSEFGLMLTRFLGPLLGGLCVATIGFAGAFALNSLSFLVSVGSLLLLQAPELPMGEREQAEQRRRPVRIVLDDIREAFLFVASVPWLWISIGIAMVGNVVYFGGLTVALPKLVSIGYGAGAWLLGMLIAAEALGSFLAALLLMLAPLRLRRRGIIAYLMLFVCFGSLLLLGVPLPHAAAPILAGASLLLAGFGITTFMIIWDTILPELVSSEKLGRVGSIDELGSSLFLPIGILLVGIVADHGGPSLIFLAGGGLMLALVIGGLCLRDIRQVA